MVAFPILKSMSCPFLGFYELLISVVIRVLEYELPTYLHMTYSPYHTYYRNRNTSNNRVNPTELICIYTHLLYKNIFSFNQNKQWDNTEGKTKCINRDMLRVRFCSLWAYWYNWKKELTVNKLVWVNEDWSKLATEAWNKHELTCSEI